MSSTSCRAEQARHGNDQGAQPGALIYLAQNGFVGDSIVDGPGLRCTIFTQGCPHRCPGCHNPETWPAQGGAPFNAGQLYDKIQAHPLCRAVTLSGGEPFAQAAALLPLARQLKQAGYSLAAYTGYTLEQLTPGGAPDQQALLALLDTLVDGPFVLDQRDLTLRFRGSTNQRILDVPKSLAAGAPVWETAERWVGGKD